MRRLIRMVARKLEAELPIAALLALTGWLLWVIASLADSWTP